MVMVTESRRRNSLNFANERKVMHLHHQGLSAPKIRLKVKNLEGPFSGVGRAVLYK